MNSGIKGRVREVKLYFGIFVCAFIVALYMYNPLQEPVYIKNNSGEIVSCSVCDKKDTIATHVELPDIIEETSDYASNMLIPVEQLAENSYAMGIFEHGRTISMDDNHIKNAIVEHVELYPKEHAQSEKTIMRKGMLVRYPDAKGTILVCHGFMCDRFDVGMLRLVFKDYNVMTFDFRAHGEHREGQYCTFGHNESQDVITAARFLRNHPELSNKPLFVYGFSMGAVASIEAQAQAALFDAMVLDCPFDSVENVIKRGLDNMKITIWGYEFSIPGRSYLEQYAFHPYVQSLVKTLLKTVAKFDPQDIQINLHPCNPVESVKKIDVPCFFIHCKNDEKVPLHAVEEVFAGANGPKQLWITNGRRHFDSYFYNPEKYAKRVKNFLNLALQGPTTVATAIDQAIIEDIDHTSNAETAIAETVSAGTDIKEVSSNEVYE